MALNYGKTLGTEPAGKRHEKTPAIPVGSLSEGMEPWSCGAAASVVLPLQDIKTMVKAEEVGKALDQSLQTVNALEVRDSESAARIIDIAAGAKKAAKTIEAALKGVIAEPEHRIKECKGFAKLFIDKAAQVEITAKGKVAAWQQQERIRKELEEREMREKIEAMNKTLRVQAEELGIEPPQIDLPTAPAAPAVIRTEGGAKSSTALVWTFDIEDALQIPREYLAIDEKKIRDAIRLGVRVIAGVKIYQKEQIRIG